MCGHAHLESLSIIICSGPVFVLFLGSLIPSHPLYSDVICTGQCYACNLIPLRSWFIFVSFVCILKCSRGPMVSDPAVV